MKNKKFILYATYPKTGSTYLPTLMNSLKAYSGDYKIERFTWNKGKNNFTIQNHHEVFLVKTHHIPYNFIKNMQKNPNQLEWIKEKISSKQIDIENAIGYTLIYNIRNPFNVLTSAISYSKILFSREEVRKKWLDNGIAEEYFINFLGFKSIPSNDEFANYSILELSDLELETILWKYLDSDAAIPIFNTKAEDGTNVSYFEHIRVYSEIIKKMDHHVLLTYENMMLRDEKMLHLLAETLDVPDKDLFSVWDLEHEKRNKGKYKNAFFSAFRTSTPEKILTLKSYSKMVKDIKIKCPEVACLL